MKDKDMQRYEVLLYFFSGLLPPSHHTWPRQVGGGCFRGIGAARPSVV